MKSLFLPASIDGCGFWRMFLPHLRIPQSRFVFALDGSYPVDIIAEADICIVQRLGNPNNIEAVKRIKASGKKLVYDLDDNIWNIPPHNRAYKWFKASKGMFTTCMQAADAITVSTQPLQAQVRANIKLKCPVYVIENGVDFNMFYPLPKKERKEVVIGWAGSATHAKDLVDVLEIIPKVLEKNPHVRFESVGASLPDNLKNHPQVRVRNTVPIAEYASRLATWRWDLFLAPLEDTAFTRSKSSIKCLEAAALQRPILVSPVGAYKDFCALDPDLEYLMCKTRQQWIDKINELVNNEGARAFYGGRMYNVAREHCDVSKSALKYVKLFAQLLGDRR